MGRGVVYFALQETEKARVDLEKAAQLYQQKGNTEKYTTVQQQLQNLQ